MTALIKVVILQWIVYPLSPMLATSVSLDVSCKAYVVGIAPIFLIFNIHLKVYDNQKNKSIASFFFTPSKFIRVYTRSRYKF